MPTWVNSLDFMHLCCNVQVINHSAILFFRARCKRISLNFLI